MDWLTTWTAWHWLVLGFALLIFEVIIPGVFFLWWGLSAVVIAGITALIPSLSLTALSVGYAVLALLLSLFWWKYQHRRDLQDQSRTSLNQRDHAMIGAKGKVETVNQSGSGRGYFGDTTWRIQGTDLNIGDMVEVVSVDGITLQVRKIQ